MLELTHIPYFVYIVIIFASHLSITPAYATELENETDLLETKYDLGLTQQCLCGATQT